MRRQTRKSEDGYSTSPDVTRGHRHGVTENQENQPAGIERETVSDSKLVLRGTDL